MTYAPYHVRDQGFTLVELLVVISIAVILIALAVPSFTTFINNQRLVSVASEFYAAVNMTRAEAIKRGGRVDMVANDGANWSSGWTVFIDKNNNLKVDSGETIVFQHDSIQATFTITNVFTDTASTYISYTGNGRSRTNASSQQPQAGTVTFGLGNATRQVVINFLGRTRICNPDVDTITCSKAN